MSRPEQVTILTIQKRLTAYVGGYVTVAAWEPVSLDAKLTRDADDDRFVFRRRSGQVQHLAFPVERIVDGDREHLIAMDPELRTIMEVAVEPHVTQRMEDQYGALLEQAGRQLADMHRSIVTFNQLPWYRRAWVAITKGV